MTSQSLGEVLPRLLAMRGFDTVFGIPGVHTVELYRGLPESGLRHVTPRHEQGAGFMADGHARACGKPAACFIISGPGMTNILTAMGQAFADSVPVLVISSVLNRDELARGEGRLHELKNQQAMVSGVAAFSHTLMAAAELPAILDRAMAVFHSQRPRPVHIELPLDVITADASELLLGAAAPARRPAPDTDSVKQAADLLESAQSPLLVLGGGARDAGNAAVDLAERIDAPTLLTINAKGLLPPDHPLLVGSLLPERAVLDALRDADVVLAVGTELGETDTLLFGERPDLHGKLIRIDIDAEQLQRNARPELAIAADSAQACKALCRELHGRPGATRGGSSRAHALRKAARQTVPAHYQLHGRVFDCVAEALPGVIIVGDSTNPVYGGNLTFNAHAPRTWFNSSTGFGTLGYGLPAALGAKLACPDTPVVCVIGDGGLQFTIAELATAVELRLSVVILLWNNQGYGEIKRYMQERSIPEIGVNIYTPDFPAIARGFGCRTATATTLQSLTTVLRAAHGAAGPTLVDIDEAEAHRW